VPGHILRIVLNGERFVHAERRCCRCVHRSIRERLQFKFLADRFQSIDGSACGAQLYVGGQFNPIGTIKGTDYIATLDPNTGAVSSWRSGMVASEVSAIVPLPNAQTVLVGGSFVTTLNWPQYNFTGFGDTSLHPPGAPKLLAEPNPLNFGEVAVGKFKEKILTLQNTGGDTLHISSIISLNNVFTSSRSSLTLAPGESVVDTIRFAPVTPGVIGSWLLITHTAVPSVDTVVMGGFAYENKFVQLVYSKEPIFFGGVPSGTQKDSVIVVSNVGNDTAAVVVWSHDTVFSAVPDSFLLAPGDSLPLSLRFAPTGTGEFFGRIYLANVRTTPLFDSIHVTGLGLFAVNVAERTSLPTEFALMQNFPNPFNPSTQFRYHLPVSSHVSLKIFDVLGKEVAAPVHAQQNAGTYSVRFDASHLSGECITPFCRQDRIPVRSKFFS
jgi:hypothetical protein